MCERRGERLLASLGSTKSGIAVVCWERVIVMYVKMATIIPVLVFMKKDACRLEEIVGEGVRKLIRKYGRKKVVQRKLDGAVGGGGFSIFQGPQRFDKMVSEMSNG